MSGRHHSQRLVLGHPKFRLQNHDDELARREIIIDQNDFMQTRPFDLYLILDRGLGDGVSHGRTAFMGHGSCASARAIIVTMIRLSRIQRLLDLYKASRLLPSEFESCV
jgi:hypothetical protein